MEARLGFDRYPAGPRRSKACQLWHKMPQLKSPRMGHDNKARAAHERTVAGYLSTGGSDWAEGDVRPSFHLLIPAASPRPVDTSGGFMTYGHVIATLGIRSPSEAQLLLRAVERELRERPGSPDADKLTEWRGQLQGLRRQADREEWPGW